MTEMGRKEAFEKYEPLLSDLEIAAAQNAYKTAVSFTHVPVPISTERIGFIAVKFALADGTTPTVLFDEFSARCLWQVFQTVAEWNWKPPLSQGGVH